MQPLSLSNWVTFQRKRNIEKTLPTDRREKLENIGFAWKEPQFQAYLEKTWNEHFEKLKEYKSIHGDCAVPTLVEEHPLLGRWVRNQRGKLAWEQSDQIKWKNSISLALCFKYLLR